MRSIHRRLVIFLTSCSKYKDIGDVSALFSQAGVKPVDGLGALGTGDATLWNFWVRNDGPSIAESSGTLCSGDDISTANDYCINAGLSRKILISSENDGSDVTSMKDSLDVLEWKCIKPASGPGIWIYSYKFNSDKSLSDLINSSGPS